MTTTVKLSVLPATGKGNGGAVHNVEVGIIGTGDASEFGYSPATRII